MTDYTAFVERDRRLARLQFACSVALSAGALAGWKWPTWVAWIALLATATARCGPRP